MRKFLATQEPYLIFLSSLEVVAGFHLSILLFAGIGKYHNDGFLKTVGTLENNQATEKGHIAPPGLPPRP
jgi:hypothetical protein